MVQILEMPQRVCPKCGGSNVVRSRRWTLLKLLTPFRRYRCHDCHDHFWGWRQKSAVTHWATAWSARTLLRWRVICPRCSSADTRRTNARNVQGEAWVNLWRFLHIPAYRCNECRGQFFALGTHGLDPKI